LITTFLRPFDAGILPIGATLNSIGIPSGLSNFQESAFCNSTETDLFSLPNPLTSNFVIFGSFLHMHDLGRKIWTDQYRMMNGTWRNIGTLGCAGLYDFSLPMMLSLNGNLFPGDSLLTSCIWDSQGNQSETTIPGCSSFYGCEMCLNYLAYYPKMTSSTVGCMTNAESVSPSNSTFQCN